MINLVKISLIGIVLSFFVASCTVQPLHSTRNADATISNEVAIEPVDTRLEQQVRNRLIFLLNGGNAEPTAPRFIASLSVSSNSGNALEVRRTSTDIDTTLTTLTVRGSVELTDTLNEGSSKTFIRETQTSYDRSTQFFANSRAEIDAENRAAEALAEELRNLILVYVKSVS